MQKKSKGAPAKKAISASNKSVKKAAAKTKSVVTKGVKKAVAKTKGVIAKAKATGTKVKQAAKKVAKQATVANAKKAVKKEVKSLTGKAKTATKTATKAVKEAAAPKKVAPKKAASKSGSTQSKKKTITPTKAPAEPAEKKTKDLNTATPYIPHGADQHFIPIHDKNAPVIAPDGRIAENLFHHNEEVALHQENQKVKANMASRMGRKRIFKMLGR